jgi:F-type H+-transporting ATPase subunit gamma
MAAMENSSSNADGLIERYTLQRNRARQAAVTRELLEIIAGAEALR